MLADLTDAELVQWFSKFKKLVPLKDKRIAFKTYKDSFSGKKAVKVIIEHFNLEKERAKELAQLFLDKEFLVHVTHASKEFKNEFCYRFTNTRRVSRKYLKIDIPTLVLPVAAEPDIQVSVVMAEDEQQQPAEVKKKMSLTQKLGSLLFGKLNTTNDIKSPELTPRGTRQKPPPSPVNLPVVPASPRVPLQLPHQQQQQQQHSPLSLSLPKVSLNLSASPSVASAPMMSPRLAPPSKNTMPRSPSKDNFEPEMVTMAARRKSRSFSDCSSYLDNSTPSSYQSEKTFNFGNVINKVKRKPLTAIDVASKKLKRHSSEADLLKDIQKSLLEIEAQSSLKYMSKQKLIAIFQKASLEDILNDFEMRQLVKSFAKEEYAEETILFWEMVQAYKKIPTDVTATDERLKRGHEIFKLFVLESGDLALNINQQLITQCTNMFLTKETPKMFDPIMTAVKGQIADLIERFKMSMIMH